ncbi:hypothetical protein IJH24_03225 [Candidatus Saccharibacteria bacterium]|nr:hypothetical protein [Candidatus Saccharibacteria bacterium]
MGLIINKENNKNDDLSRRIDADLRAKMNGSVDIVDGETPDLVDESEYVKDYKKTGKFGWVWIVLIVLAILSLISIFAF